MIKKGLIGIMILGALFIVINRLLGLSERRIETAMSYVTYPLLQFQRFVVHSFSPSYKQGIVHVLADLEKVTLERDTLLNELISLKALLRTVEDTSDLRDFMKRYNAQSLVIAPVLLRNFSGENFFLVDAGENFGIEKDMIALYHNMLVGKVTHVYPSYSKILLITDPHCYVAAVCSSNGVKGMHHGLKKGFTTLAYVDHRDQVTVGDTVLSSGEGGLFPRGFGLGRITDVDQGGYGRSITIEPSLDLKKISQVSIVPHTFTDEASDSSVAEELPLKPAES